MALEVDDQPILSEGEWVELCRHMKPGEASPTLTAWAAGEPVTPLQLQAALNVDARLAAKDERAHQILDLAIKRVVHAFPKLAMLAAA